MTTTNSGCIIYYDSDGGPILRTVTADDVAELERSRDFYQVRVQELQKLLLKMPEPWATLCADIVANGFPRYWGIGESLPARDDVARLERLAEIAAAIMREVGSKVSPRLLAAWQEAQGE